jgi:hypothetical protein
MDIKEGIDVRDLHEFDSETGQELETSVKRSLVIDKDIAIQECDALTQLKACEGYKIFEKYLDENIQYYSKELLKAADLNTVIRCQEIIKSYTGIQTWLMTKIDIGTDLKNSDRE